MANKFIKTITERNRTFTIVNQDGWFCAIEDKYITAGKLNTSLNGGQMFAARELDECVNRVHDRVELDYLESTGLSKAEAFAQYFGMMEQLEMLREMYK